MASKKFAKAQEEAKKYVDQHNLERFVTQMMNGMIQAKPADPKVYMIRFIAERMPAEKLEASGIFVEGLPPPTSPKQAKSKSPPKAGVTAASSDAAAEGTRPSKGDSELKAEELGGGAAASIAASIRADIMAQAPAPAAETTLPKPQSADSETHRWAQVEEWEQLTRLLDEGVQLPPPGATEKLGGPKWLASLMAGKNEEQTLGRLKWLSQKHGSYLFLVDSDGTNLAMAISGRMGGEGQWNDWLFDRGICNKDAKDATGKSLQDWAKSSAGAGVLPVSTKSMEALRALPTWECLVEDIEAGGEVMAGGTSSRQIGSAPLPDSFGSPTWLAGLITLGGPEKVVERLQWLSDQSASTLYQVDSEGVNVAMALGETLGEGAWLDWLFDRAICMKGATDNAGRTAQDYCTQR